MTTATLTQEKKSEKFIVLTCSECHKHKVFTGQDVDAVIHAIDEADWHDGPENDYCPTCWAALEDDDRD